MKLKIAIITDNLTYSSLQYEYIKVFCINRKNWMQLFTSFKPDLILVESAWQGYKDNWKFKIASYPDYPERNNLQLVRLLDGADKYNIPAVFWNKEDGVHFNRFIDSASLFKYILTVDENCVPRYRAILGKGIKVGVLPFAIQPKIHHPTWFPSRYRDGLFIGSYGTHMHNARRQWQDMVFRAVSPFGLTIVDRNSDRKSEVYRFPNYANFTVKPAVPYNKTGKLIRQHPYCLNVNTITNSPSMFSRRLIEIMACRRLAVTNPSLAVSTRFEGMCEVIETQEQATELFAQLLQGYTIQQIEMMRYASNHVLQHYTYEKWLQHIVNFIGL